MYLQTSLLWQEGFVYTGMFSALLSPAGELPQLPTLQTVYWERCLPAARGWEGLGEMVLDKGQIWARKQSGNVPVEGTSFQGERLFLSMLGAYSCRSLGTGMQKAVPSVFTF